ncbi:MAG TPA: rhodanese-like domain-containing protein [Thermoanaerobaculia bacterium]|jgi:rhodanese-related sulfurtransferase|nr:rhodanese-like domain-containing protein [Thermoanaerobaculia bacterium]
MAKPQHTQAQETSSKTSLIYLAIGALLIAGLVGWALTRTVETPPPITSSSVADAASTPAPSTPAPETTTDSFGAMQPIASATAPMSTTSNPSAPPPTDHASYPRISVEDLREKTKAGNVTVIDVRDAGAYAAAHVPGSLHIALSSVESNLDLLPKDKNAEIVTYCTCPAEESSISAGEILNRHGYKNVKALFGGLVAWRQLDYPLDKGPK